MAPSGCVFKSGAYIKTKSRVVARSTCSGRWDRIDCLPCQYTRTVERSVGSYSMLANIIRAISVQLDRRNHYGNCLPLHLVQADLLWQFNCSGEELMRGTP